MNQPVNILVEGLTDEFVARRLLKHVNLEVGTVYGKKGKSYLLQRLPQYNKAAQFYPWFTIIDLDTSYSCPVEAMNQWLPGAAQGMRFRIAVHAVEAWLIADQEHMAKFLAVSISAFQRISDNDPKPKDTLINLARLSHNKSVKEDIIPKQNSGAKVGPLYVARMLEFIEQHWEPEIASQNCNSLRRCINALIELRACMSS